MLPHFRRIARKIFGYKQQKAHKKHRHAPNTACPLLCRLFTPPIQQTNTPPPYFHLPRRAFPTPRFLYPVFFSQTAYSTIHPPNASRAFAPAPQGFNNGRPFVILCHSPIGTSPIHADAAGTGAVTAPPGLYLLLSCFLFCPFYLSQILQ